MIQAEIARIVSQVVGPELRREINTLKQDGQEYLFAGITVGAEARLRRLFSRFEIVAPAPAPRRPGANERREDDPAGCSVDARR